MKPIRLAYLLSHPIQYQAPLLKAIAAQPDIDLSVFYESDLSVGAFHDREFNREIAWDVRLLDGYRHQFLRPSAPLRPRELPNLWRPRGSEIVKLLRAQRFDALWVHGYMAIEHWRALGAARAAGTKTLLRDEANATSSQRHRLKDAIKPYLFRRLDRSIDAYLAIGAANAAYYAALGVAADKIHPMPYAVDNRWFRARILEAGQSRQRLRAALGIAPDALVVLSAAKLLARKRPLDLLEAFLKADSKEAALLYAGDGEMAETIRARLDADEKRVRLLGFQSQAQMAALYDLADVMVLPSERESWGLVVNEAMNGACAIVVSDRVGAGLDLVREGENGAVFPVGDITALGAILRDLLTHRERLAAMGEASLRIVAEWSFAQDIAGLRAALHAVLPDRPG